MAHSALGQVDLAVQDINAALEVEPESAVFLNTYAWLLVTWKVGDLDAAVKAVELASKAVQLSPAYNTWNTLGAALYRAGRYEEAIKALQESQRRALGVWPWNLFFLAMAHWQLGNFVESRHWYEKGVVWMEQNPDLPEPLLRELRQFRYEAEQTLGIPHHEDAGGAVSNVIREKI